MKTPTTLARKAHAGFGLVELMVAMTLGFIVVGAVGYLYLGSRSTFRTTDNLSRMQESARFALDTLSKEIRIAGFIGCGNLANTSVSTIANPPIPAISPATAIVGYDNGTGWTNPTSKPRVAGDVIRIQGAFGAGVSITGNCVPVNANLQITGNPYGFVQDDVLIVSNCTNTDVFRVTNSPGNSGLVTLAHANSTNSSNNVSATYCSDASIFRFEQYDYFIALNPAGRRALYRASIKEGAVELVDNIENMQVTYGRDTNGDRTADVYGDATSVGANWNQVVSARVNLLVASPDSNVTPAAQTYIFDSASVPAGDRRLYQSFTTTIGIRNRLP